MSEKGNIQSILLGCAVIVLGLVTLFAVDVLFSRLFHVISSMLGPDAAIGDNLLSIAVLGVLCVLLGVSWVLLWTMAGRTGTLPVLLGCAAAVFGLTMVFTVSGLPVFLWSAAIGSISSREPDAQAAVNRMLFVLGPYVSLVVAWLLLWMTARRAKAPWPAKIRRISLGCFAVILGLSTVLTVLSRVKAIEAWQFFNVQVGLSMLFGGATSARLVRALLNPYVSLAILWLLLWGIARLTRPRSGNG